MIKQLAGTSIWSENLNNLLPFYRDVLGLKASMETPDYVILGANESGAPTLGLGTHSQVHGPNTDSARHMIALSTDDLNGDWERLKAAGVEFIDDPKDFGPLSIATLKDPEGNLVQLFQFHPS